MAWLLPLPVVQFGEVVRGNLAEARRTQGTQRGIERKGIPGTPKMLERKNAGAA
jgi:hypothetical protein